MVTFSKTLIEEYRTEMATTYGVFVAASDAQIQLRTLVRSMFPTVIAEQETESRELVQGKAQPTCSNSLSVTLESDGGDEVGASITPTSGHSKQNTYG